MSWSRDRSREPGGFVILSGAIVGSEVEGSQLSALTCTSGSNMPEPASRSFDSDSQRVLVSAQDDWRFDTDSYGVLVSTQDDEREAGP